MEFGYVIHSNVLGQFSFEEISKIVKLSEEEGLDFMWVPDIKYSRDYVAMATFIALNTEKLGIGATLIDPFVRHPALNAVAIATIDEISGGRTFVGLVEGTETTLAKMGIKMKKPVLAMKETAEVMRAIWSGEMVSYHGSVIKMEDIKYLAKARKNIPIYFFMCDTAERLQMAGEVANCAVIFYKTSEKVQWGMNHVKIGAEKAGRDPAEVEIATYVYSNINEDSEKAVRILRESALHPVMAKAGLMSSDTQARLGDWDRLKQHTIAGTSEECIKEFKTLAQLGVNRVMIRPSIEETPQSFERFIKALGREVIPQVK